MLDAARAVDGAAEGRLPPVLQVTAAPSASRRHLRSGGINVTCDAARPGNCRVRVSARGVVVARGAVVVTGAKPVVIHARPTREARLMLVGRRALKARIDVALTGVAGVRRPLLLRAR